MARFGGSTVYDRAKKTGYLTGPRHKVLNSPDTTPADDDGDTAADDTDQDSEAGESASTGPGGDGGNGGNGPDSEDNGKGPPNLRDSDGPESCADCLHFSQGGASTAGADYEAASAGGSFCNKYQARVTPNEVCDGYEPLANPMEEASVARGGAAGAGGPLPPTPTR